jgi:acyl-coenzyme A synthetase/AMP-(fatty) acid ligase
LNAAERLLGAAALARHGTRIALVADSREVSFSQLAEDVRRASSALVALGVRPGDRVLLLMRDTPECAAAWLGVVRVGAVAVALNTKLAEAEYRHILADTAARLVIIEDVFATARPDLTSELAREGRIIIAGEALQSLPHWRDAVAAAPATPAFDAQADAPAFMLYSSGTTGAAKGIVHTHASIGHAGAAFRCFGLGEGDAVLTTSKFFFAYGLEHGLLAPLALGVTTILCAEWPSAESILAQAARRPLAALFSVPTLYRRLLAEGAERLAPLRGTRRFVSAGEHPSAQLAHQWRAAAGGELLNLYGMSETFCACMVTPLGTSDGSRTGVPLEGVEVRLGENDEAGVVPAMLWVRHPAQARGYANRPQETAAQFRDGWFCTRDLFTRDATGSYVYQGRADDLVKIAGQWVRPAELEDAVAALDGIAEAACVVVPDSDGLDRLALFVAAKAGAQEALEAAATACERALPRHKRPKWLRAVDQLPRTATGKVQRFKLRELLEAELAAKR